MAVTVVTWNVQGNEGVDAAAVAAVLHDLAADVVCLQEVQRAQYRALRHALGFAHGRWAFKHWPVRAPAEGHAILCRAPVRAETRAISSGEPPWSWRRRVAQVGRADPLDGLVLVNTHLAAGAGAASRDAQVGRLLDRVVPDVLAGDLNEAHGAALDSLRAAGLRDAWAVVHGDAPCTTNWSPDDAARTRPPTQRLDWLWVSPAVRVRSARLGEWERTARLSDHVPLAVDLEVGERT